jgi:hypothetical protein
MLSKYKFIIYRYGALENFGFSSSMYNSSSPHFWAKDMGQNVMLLGNILSEHSWGHLAPLHLLIKFFILNLVHHQIFFHLALFPPHYLLLTHAQFTILYIYIYSHLYYFFSPHWIFEKKKTTYLLLLCLHYKWTNKCKSFTFTWFYKAQNKFSWFYNYTNGCGWNFLHYKQGVNKFQFSFTLTRRVCLKPYIHPTMV